MSGRMSKKEQYEKLIANMRRWQGVENAAVAQTAKIMAATENPLIRLMMEIIQRDSNMHHRVQQLIIDGLGQSAMVMSVDELSAVWDDIEHHIEIEKKTIELANESLAMVDHPREGIYKYLLNYLLEDEKKHDKLLDDLKLIRKGLNP